MINDLAALVAYSRRDDLHITERVLIWQREFGGSPWPSDVSDSTDRPTIADRNGFSLGIDSLESSRETRSRALSRFFSVFTRATWSQGRNWKTQPSFSRSGEKRGDSYATRARRRTDRAVSLLRAHRSTTSKRERPAREHETRDSSPFSSPRRGRKYAKARYCKTWIFSNCFLFVGGTRAACLHVPETLSRNF